MMKRFVTAAGIAAALVTVLVFFAACGTGQRAAPRPTIIPPTDINPVMFDDFNHAIASPLNGHNGQWGNDMIHLNGLGYWFGGVSSESMVLLEPYHGVHVRVATFGLAASANSWGRIFQNREGIPAPLGAPAAIGVRFMAREASEHFVGAYWALYVRAGRGAGGPPAGLLFQITEQNEWQEFTLYFPPDFRSDWITAYDFWMRDPFPASAMLPAAAAAMSVSQMRFVYAEDAVAAEVEMEVEGE